MNHKFRLLLTILLALTFVAEGVNAQALRQTDKDALHRRTLALQKLLSLSAPQTDSIESILVRTREQGAENRRRFDDDYYKLAIANLATMDTMRRQVDSILTDSQRRRYARLRSNTTQHFSSHDGEVLTRRLGLDSVQSRTVDMILSYAERDIREIQRESADDGGAFGRGFRGDKYRGAMNRRRAKMEQAHKAISILLTDEQKKEFREYVDEQMEQFRPHDTVDDRDRDGGF